MCPKGHVMEEEVTSSNQFGSTTDLIVARICIKDPRLIIWVKIIIKMRVNYEKLPLLRSQRDNRNYQSIRKAIHSSLNFQRR